MAVFEHVPLLRRLRSRSHDAERPRRRRIRSPLGWALGALGCAAGLGLTIHLAAAEAPRPVAPAPEPTLPWFEDGVLHMPESYAERIDLRAATVEHRTIAPRTEVTGELDFSPAHVAAVGAHIFGRVHRVLVEPGDRVEEGSPLASLESTELARAQAELVSTRARESVARTDHARKRLLVEEGIAAHRSAELAAGELEAARADRRAAEETVAAMGGATRADARLGRFSLRAPISGEVTAVNVYRGQAVQPDHLAFEIADLSELWLELAVYETDLPNVREGDEVSVRPHGDAVTVVGGRVEHVGSIVDSRTRTATVRVRVDNAERKLRVGQAVRATIISQGSEIRALAVPRDSVFLVDGRPTVFVVSGTREVVPRALTLGARDDEFVEVLDGLSRGESVVVSGGFELKSELFR